jgi:hypothetical protein
MMNEAGEIIAGEINCPFDLFVHLSYTHVVRNLSATHRQLINLHLQLFIPPESHKSPLYLSQISHHLGSNRFYWMQKLGAIIREILVSLLSLSDC